MNEKNHKQIQTSLYRLILDELETLESEAKKLSAHGSVRAKEGALLDAARLWGSSDALNDVVRKFRYIINNWSKIDGFGD